MQIFRLGSIGPLWLEEFIFLVADETRRFPRRIAALADKMVENGMAAAWRFSERTAQKPGTAAIRHEPAARAPVHEAELLDEQLAWELAVDPLVESGNSAANAAALHAAAAEQLDALTYNLDRLRDELRPIMTYARIADDTVYRLAPPAPSLDQLLELARENAKTRPKERILTAA
jgi:hypothetical protein